MAEGNPTEVGKTEEYVLTAYDPDYAKVMEYVICPVSREDSMSEEEDLGVFAYIDDEVLATGDYRKILQEVVEVTGISLVPSEEAMCKSSTGEE